MNEQEEPLVAALEARAETYRRIAAGMAGAAERSEMESIGKGYAAEAAALRPFRPRSERRRGRRR